MPNPFLDNPSTLSGIEIVQKPVGERVTDWMGGEHVMSDDEAIIASARVMYVTPAIYEAIKRATTDEGSGT